MHLNLLIICVALSPVIIGTISSGNINESSDLLVRNKRVLNYEHGGDVPVRPGTFRFVVNIEKHNQAHCVGSIISVWTVITSSICASEHISAYKVIYGSINSYGGAARNVIEKKIRLGNYVGARADDGIALFKVHSPFAPNSYFEIIHLHTEPILRGIPATVAGWGCYYYIGARGTLHPRMLRSITVPIMPHRECVDAYRGIYEITDEDVCIYDEEKHCGHTDSGAPLIIDGKLAGVYLRRGPFPFYNVPEIFILLQHAHYSQWISENIVHYHLK